MNRLFLPERVIRDKPVTFDTYGHLMPGSRDQVRERMDAHLAAPA